MLLACALLVVVAGCGDRKKAEARMVVDRVRAIDPYSAVAVRGKLVDGLAKLDVQAPDVRKVRDACVHAHRELLEAEGLQSDAKKALDQAQSAKTAGKLTDAQAERIAHTIKRSNEALVEASVLLPKCQAQVAKLASRYEIKR